MNTRGGYGKSLKDIKRSFAEVSTFTGLRFKYQGRTRKIAIKQRNPRNTDILVSFASPKQVGRLRGKLGYAVARGHQKKGLTGVTVALNRTVRYPRSVWSNVIRHEIGHTLNIGHAHSPSQLMFKNASRKRQVWGAGDLQMLSKMGASSGCWR